MCPAPAVPVVSLARCTSALAISERFCRVLLWGRDHRGPVGGDSVQGHTRVESRTRHRSRFSRACKVSRLVPLGGSSTVRRDTPLPATEAVAVGHGGACRDKLLQGAMVLLGFGQLLPQVVVSRHAAPRKVSWPLSGTRSQSAQWE